MVFLRERLRPKEGEGYSRRAGDNARQDKHRRPAESLGADDTDHHIQEVDGRGVAELDPWSTGDFFLNVPVGPEYETVLLIQVDEEERIH